MTILKFFLHISKEEQKERLEERLKDPARNWKISPADLKERERWNDYVKAYEAVLKKCSMPTSPWFVIPSNKKWFRNLAVSQIIVETLEQMNPKFPKAAFDVSKLKVNLVTRQASFWILAPWVRYGSRLYAGGEAYHTCVSRRRPRSRGEGDEVPEPARRGRSRRVREGIRPSGRG